MTDEPTWTQTTTYDTPAARRERIATAALQGLLANSDRGAIGYGKTYAGTAVERADALIAELDRTEEGSSDAP